MDAPPRLGQSLDGEDLAVSCRAALIESLHEAGAHDDLPGLFARFDSALLG